MIRTILENTTWLFLLTGLIFLPATAVGQASQHEDPEDWEIHDTDRPQPPVVDPGPALDESRPAPADAIILFDGTSLDAWETPDGEEAGWRLEDGYMVVEPGTGEIQTREGLGDVQLHIEWAAPEEIDGEGQERGNSGIFLMGLYEVQVLDCYENETYPDGQAASVYGQYPPLVNACREPGEWQTYDIIWTRPRFDDAGELEEPARVTVLHNGVLVQNNVELTGPTGHYERPSYEAHEDRLPLRLQDHSDEVRFRSIWARELDGEDETSAGR